MSSTQFMKKTPLALAFAMALSMTASVYAAGNQKEITVEGNEVTENTSWGYTEEELKDCGTNCTVSVTPGTVDSAIEVNNGAHLTILGGTTYKGEKPDGFERWDSYYQNQWKKENQDTVKTTINTSLDLTGKDTKVTNNGETTITGDLSLGTQTAFENTGKLTVNENLSLASEERSKDDIGLGATLTNKGRVTVTGNVDLDNNTLLQNSGKLTINGDLSWTAVPKSKADEEKKNIIGSIQNTGTITLTNAKISINDTTAQTYVSKEGVLEFGKKDEQPSTNTLSSNEYLTIAGGNHQVGSDPTQERGEKNPKKEKPTAIQMGSVTMWHANGEIHQNNTGYYEIKRKKNKDQAQTFADEETKKRYEKQYSSYVSFDTVSLMGANSKFISGRDARETVDHMVLAGSGSTADINGSSTWGALTFGSTESKDSKDAVSPRTVMVHKYTPNSAFTGETIGEGNLHDRILTIGEVVMVGDATNLEISNVATKSTTKATQDSIIVEEGAKVAIGGFSNRSNKTLTITGDFFGPAERASFDPNKGAIDPTLQDRVTVGGSLSLSFDFTNNNFAEGKENPTQNAQKVDSLQLSGFNPYVTYVAEEEKSEEKADETKSYKHVGTVYHAQKFGSLSTNGLASFTLGDSTNELTSVSNQNKVDGGEAVKVSGDVLFGTAENPLMKAANISLSSISMSETWVRGYKTIKPYEEKLEDSDSVDKTKAPVTRSTCSSCDKGFSIKGNEVAITNKISNMGVLIREGIRFTKPDEDHYQEFDFGRVTLDKPKTEQTLADGENKPEDKTWKAGDKVYSDPFKATDVTLTIDNAQVKAGGALRMQTGHLSLTGNSVLAVAGVKGPIQGEITVETNGLLMLGHVSAVEYDSLWGYGQKAEGDDLTPINPAPTFKTETANIFIGQGLVFGEGGKLTVGTSSTLGGIDSSSPVVSLNGVTVLDARSAFYNGNSFFTNAYKPETAEEGAKADAGKNGSLTISGDLHINNLAWGVYTLQEGFEHVDLTGLGENNLHFTIAEGWQQQAPVSFDKNTNQITVGGTTVAGSGFENVAATGMLNQIFAGNRKTMDGDKQLVDSFLLQNVLANVGQDKAPGVMYTIADAAKDIDRMTLVGVASGTNAIAFDLSSYTADVIEHHASTVPHNMGREWIKPIGMSLTQDDMSVATLKTGYDITAAGFMVGRDFALKSGDMVGIAGSWLGGDADGQGDTTMMDNEVKNYGVHLWGAHHYNDDITILGTVSYVKQTVDAKSNTLGINFAGKQKSQMIAAGVRAEMTYEMGNFKMTPHVGGRVMYHTADEYTIRAQGLDAFNVESDDAMIFEVPVGLTMSTTFEYQRWNVQPYVDMTVRGRFGDTDSTVKVSGVNLGSPSEGNYDITGSYTADLTVGYMSTFKDLNLGMSYGMSAGELGRMNQRIEATLRIDLK